MEIVALEFYNAEATPHVTRLNVSRTSIAPIMAWYGAYYAGDDYGVLVDGVEITKDKNGEFEPVTFDHAPQKPSAE